MVREEDCNKEILSLLAIVSYEGKSCVYLNRSYVGLRQIKQYLQI